MEKKITTVYIEKEIREHAKTFKISLTDFINLEYRRKYLSLESKMQRLQKLDVEKEDLLKEIRELRERLENAKIELTVAEQRNLSTVKVRQRKGMEISSMWRFFNSEYNRNFTLVEFEQLVNLYESQCQKRVEEAMYEKKNPRRRK